MDDDFLTRLKLVFLEKRTDETFYAFIYQLSKECLIIPVEGSFEENSAFLSSLESGEAELGALNAHTLTRDGFILAYSSECEIPEDLPTSFVYLDIFQLESALGEKRGFIIDPDTYPIRLEKDMIVQIAAMKREGRI